MNRYSENIAELLLLGRTELDDFYAARSDLDQSLMLLARLSEQELAFARTEADRAEETAESRRIEAMRTLFEEIDMTTQTLLVLRNQGRLDEAIRLFREDIEDSLDADLEVHIEAAIRDEELQLQSLDRALNALEDRMMLQAIGVALAALVITSVAGIMLARSLTRPIEELIAGARAIGEGNLAYRINYRRHDEFAELTRQFDGAAARLEAQHGQLLEVQAGLESEVARRTSQLEEANDRLQRLDEMRILFLADIGHELRTPLTVLRGEAEVALRGERSVDEHRETLRRIVQLAQQMGRLVEDLLFLARAEVGVVRFEMQALELQDVLEVAVSEARVLAAASGLRVEAQMPDEPVRVEADPERLTQALLIVLDNAAKYSDRGETIGVALARGDGEARVTVTSVGVGIPAEDLPYVFNRFYRGSRGPKHGASGSGLGLPIAKWILDTHGGDIAITSSGSRTAVTLRLPLRNGKPWQSSFLSRTTPGSLVSFSGDSWPKATSPTSRTPAPKASGSPAPATTPSPSSTECSPTSTASSSAGSSGSKG
jgi:signal transduction histidine kinase